MDESQIIFDEEEGVDPENIRLARPSHNELLKKLNWIKGPACVQIEDEQYCFDPFWFSGPSILLEEDLKELDALWTFIEVDMEHKITSHIPSIRHVGGFPFSYTLFYSTSTIDDLKSKHFLRVDFPLLGGYISYKSDASKNEIGRVYKDNRKFFEKSLSDRGFKWQVFWGYLKNTIQYPNIIYFAKDNKFLYAEDVYQGKSDTHSIFFDYLDIFTSPLNKRNPNETINFIGNVSKRKTYEDFEKTPKTSGDATKVYKEESVTRSKSKSSYIVEVKQGDIKILFEDISKEARILDSFEISALDLKLIIRQPGLFKFHNRCKEVT